MGRNSEGTHPKKRSDRYLLRFSSTRPKPRTPRTGGREPKKDVRRHFAAEGCQKRPTLQRLERSGEFKGVLGTEKVFDGRRLVGGWSLGLGRPGNKTKPRCRLCPRHCRRGTRCVAAALPSSLALNRGYGGNQASSTAGRGTPCTSIPTAALVIVWLTSHSTFCPTDLTFHTSHQSWHGFAVTGRMLVDFDALHNAFNLSLCVNKVRPKHGRSPLIANR